MRIYLCIPHSKDQFKPYLIPWFSAAWNVALAHRYLSFFTNRINLKAISDSLSIVAKEFLNLPKFLMIK